MIRGLLSLGIVFVADLYALDPSRKLWHYGYSQWRDRDGLPQNTVQAIAQTKDGYLWLGTEAGLVRFNGRTFRTFDTSNEPAFRSNSVTAVVSRPDGGLWIGTRAGLVAYHEGIFRRAEGLPNETVRALALDSDGSLWVGTNGGVSRWSGNRLDGSWARRNGLVSNAVRAFALSKQILWVGMGGGLNRIQAREVVPSPVRIPTDTVRAICVDRTGVVWIGTEASGLYTSTGRRYTVRDGLSSNSIRALIEDRNGSLWIGTVGGGLVRLHNGRFDTMTRAEGLASDHVRALLEDREGSIWVGTEAGGLAQLRDGQAITYSTIDGLRSDFVRAVGGDRDGRLWVGTEGAGLHRFALDRFQPEDSLGIPKAFVTALHLDRAGNRWIGTEGNGAVRLGSAGRREFSTAGGLSDNSVWAIAETADGAVWLGSSNGLVRVLRGEVRVYRTADGLRGNSIRSLHAARDGSLWIGMRSVGLQRFHNGRFETFDHPDIVRNTAFTSFLEEPDGSLWMSSSAGVWHWDGNGLRVFGARNGLFSENLFQVLDDRQGRLWLSSSRGIFAVSKRDLLANRPVFPLVVDHSDGMRSSECSGDAQPAGWRAPDGDLWFATIGGVVRVRPGGFSPAPPVPNVVVEQVSINGEATEGRVSPPGNRLFAVKFAALTFLAPDKTRYRYRLEGLDREWIETVGQTEAVYHGLPPGSYAFRVAAAIDRGEWSPEAPSVPLDVKPYFYQTPWFGAVAIVGLVCIGYSVHRARTSVLHREFAAVLGERARIAREIHDTLLQGFAGSALQLGAIAKRWRRDPDAAAIQLESVLAQIDGCLAEARREIGELREPQTSRQTFSEKLRLAALGATSVEVLGEQPVLPLELEKGLLRIARESVSNAVRHASARTILVEVRFQPGLVRLVTRDDGKGLSASVDRKPGHFGLQGMRERTELLGGRFILRSEPATGTEIEVTLPV